MPRAHVRPRTIIVSAAAILVGLAVLIVLRSIPDLTRIASGFTAARAAVGRADTRGRTGGYRDAAAIAGDLDTATAALTRAAEVAESTPFLRYIPGVAALTAGAGHAAVAASGWTRGAAELVHVVVDGAQFADRYANRTLSDLTASDRAAILGHLGSALARSRNALDTMDRGTAVRDALLATVPCPGILNHLRSWQGPFCRDGHLAQEVFPLPPRARELRRDAGTAVDAVSSLLALVGGGREHHILILFLNNTELRPGGGFLGTYGVATVRNGELTDFRTDDVYNLDRRVEGTLRLDPPAPFRDHHIVPYWYLRDANWSPDFAASSRTVLDFYAREGGGSPPDMVVGFTPTFAASLLRIVGPVTVGGITFTAENVADELEYEVEKGYYEQGVPRPQRKGIVAPLAHAVMDRLSARPLRDLRPLGDAVVAAIREKHLMAYAPDPVLQAGIARAGAAGTVARYVDRDDTLMVVDANLGSLKTDPVIQRSIRYAITPDQTAGYRGVVVLRYRNTGMFSWKTTRYRTYTRVYLPPGTSLLRSDGAMREDRSDAPGRVDAGSDLGRAVFGAFVSIEPGQERTLAFEFALASGVVDRIRRGSYALEVVKQLGTWATPLTLDFDFGTTVESAVPPEPPAAWGDSHYLVTTDLREDRQFTLQLRR